MECAVPVVSAFVGSTIGIFIGSFLAAFIMVYRKRGHDGPTK